MALTDVSRPTDVAMLTDLYELTMGKRQARGARLLYGVLSRQALWQRLCRYVRHLRPARFGRESALHR